MAEESASFEVLIVAASPQPSSPTLVAALARQAHAVIAADAGAAILKEAGVFPDAFVGDADSATPEVAAWARSVATFDERYPKEKDDTDLALAIALARRMAAAHGVSLSLTLTCAAGGRPDHALAVLGRLAANADVSPREIEDEFECRILAPEGRTMWRVGRSAQLGATVSAIAVAPDTLVSEQGMRWELDHEALELLADRGVSNIVTDKDACITCHAGCLACWCMGISAETVQSVPHSV